MLVRSETNLQVRSNGSILMTIDYTSSPNFPAPEMVIFSLERRLWPQTSMGSQMMQKYKLSILSNWGKYHFKLINIYTRRQCFRLYSESKHTNSNIFHYNLEHTILNEISKIYLTMPNMMMSWLAFNMMDDILRGRGEYQVESVSHRERAEFTTSSEAQSNS